MIRLAAILSAFVLFLNGNGQAAEKPVHIFILSGQSNMAGMKPKTGFEPESKKLFPDAQVVYFKIAQGGQPIRLWVEEYAEIAKKRNLTVQDQPTKFYKPILEQYGKLLEKHPQPASVTFCWMQGERDSRADATATIYADALTQLIANLRRDLKQPEMNFVIARISDHGKPGNTNWQTIRKAHVKIATDDKHGAWVDCDDLNDKEKDGVKRNDLHYTKEGYELLGHRFARQAKALISGARPDAKGRPE